MASPYINQAARRTKLPISVQCDDAGRITVRFTFGTSPLTYRDCSIGAAHWHYAGMVFAKERVA